MMASQGQKATGSPVGHDDCPGCKGRIQGLAHYCPFCGAALVRKVASSGERARATAAVAAESGREHAPVRPRVEQAPAEPTRPTFRPAKDEPVDEPVDDPVDELLDEPAIDDAPKVGSPGARPSAPSQALEERKPPGRGLRPVAIAAALLIVAGAAFYALRDSGDPVPEERVTPVTASEPVPAPDSAPSAQREQPVRPPTRPAPEPARIPEPEPPRRLVMLDEQRSLQYVRPDLSSNARVREFPSTSDSRVLASLAPGSEVMVTGRVSDGDWLRVSASGFSEGYISASMLTREPPVSYPTQIRGQVEDMRDTATLIVDGDTVHLLGVAPGTGEPYITQMQRFIREQGNTVACRHVERGRYRCAVRAGDLGELLLINGAGRAAPDAPQSYFDNERLAQDNRRGLWAQ